MTNLPQNPTLMIVRKPLHPSLVMALILCASSCSSDASMPITTEAPPPPSKATATVEVKAGWADKAHLNMTRSAFLEAYADDVIKEEPEYNYTSDGSDELGLLVEKNGEPWLYAFFNYYEQKLSTDSIAFIVVLSPKIMLYGGLNTGLTAAEVATAYPDLVVSLWEIDEIERGTIPSLPGYLIEFNAPANGLVGKYQAVTTPRADGQIEEYVGLADPTATITYIQFYEPN